jgi:hypothetical protein
MESGVDHKEQALVQEISGIVFSLRFAENRHTDRRRIDPSRLELAMHALRTRFIECGENRGELILCKDPILI